MDNIEGAVQLDHKLEKTANSSTVELCKHRWHWTMDPTNPDRVSFSVYANKAGKSKNRVASTAKGYMLWTDSGESRPIEEFVERANMAEELQLVVEIFSEIFNISFQYARRKYMRTIKEIRAKAREKVESTDSTTYEEAVREICSFSYHAHKTRVNERKQMAKNLGIRFTAIEAQLVGVYNDLAEAVTRARDVEWGAQERDIITQSIDKVQSNLDVLRAAITGSSETDWDAAMAKLLTA